LVRSNANRRPLTEGDGEGVGREGKA
jgi:hypothetical protein